MKNLGKYVMEAGLEPRSLCEHFQFLGSGAGKHELDLRRNACPCLIPKAMIPLRLEAGSSKK